MMQEVRAEAGNILHESLTHEPLTTARHFDLDFQKLHWTYNDLA